MFKISNGQIAETTQSQLKMDRGAYERMRDSYNGNTLVEKLLTRLAVTRDEIREYYAKKPRDVSFDDWLVDVAEEIILDGQRYAALHKWAMENK